MMPTSWSTRKAPFGLDSQLTSHGPATFIVGALEDKCRYRSRASAMWRIEISGRVIVGKTTRGNGA